MFKSPNTITLSPKRTNKSTNKTRLSENKYKTLKQGFNNRSKNNSVPETDFNFSITYEEEDLTVIYSQNTNLDSKILIRRPENKTNCIVMNYDNDTGMLELESLLYDVDKTDKCRINKSGAYYIDIMFMIIKSLLLYPKIKFSPCLVLLLDGASKEIFKFDLSKNQLSIYRLLIDGRTFYEGYGFIPIEISECSSLIDYIKLEQLISIRTKLLKINLNEIIPYITNIINNPILKQGNLDKLLTYLNTIIKLVMEHGVLKLNTSLSIVFKNIITKDELTILEQQLCDAIYNFVDITLPEILNILGLVISSHRIFSYIITSDKSHYDKVAAIYAKYDIKRYEEYSNYLELQTTAISSNNT